MINVFSSYIRILFLVLISLLFLDCPRNCVSNTKRLPSLDLIVLVVQMVFI